MVGVQSVSSEQTRHPARQDCPRRDLLVFGFAKTQNFVKSDRVAIADGTVLRRPKEASVFVKQGPGGPGAARVRRDWIGGVVVPHSFQMIGVEQQTLHSRFFSADKEVPD